MERDVDKFFKKEISKLNIQIAVYAVAIILIVAFIILRIVLFAIYKDTNVSDLPTWVAFFLWGD